MIFELDSRIATLHALPLSLPTSDAGPLPQDNRAHNSKEDCPAKQYGPHNGPSR